MTRRAGECGRTPRPQPRPRSFYQSGPRGRCRPPNVTSQTPRLPLLTPTRHDLGTLPLPPHPPGSASPGDGLQLCDRGRPAAVTRGTRRRSLFARRFPRVGCSWRPRCLHIAGACCWFSSEQFAFSLLFFYVHTFVLV